MEVPREEIAFPLLHDYKRAVEARKLAEKIEQGLYAQLFAKTKSGEFTGASIKVERSYKLTDREALYRFIYDNKAVDLLQARLTPSAIALRLEDGITIPGISSVETEKLEI